MKTVSLTLGAALFVSLYLGLPTPALEPAVTPPAPAVTPVQFAAAPPVAMPTAPVARPQVPLNNLSTVQTPNAVQAQQLAALANMIRLQSFTLSNRIHFVGQRHRRTFFNALRWTHMTTGTARR
jgi:hypothetical protein